MHALNRAMRRTVAQLALWAAAVIGAAATVAALVLLTVTLLALLLPTALYLLAED